MRADCFIELKQTSRGDLGSVALDVPVIRLVTWAGRHWLEIRDDVFRKLAFKSFAKNC